MAGSQYFDSIGGKRGVSTFEIPDPWNVKVVGVDVPAAKYPQFYDASSSLEPDPWLVEDIRQRGQRAEVEVWRDPENDFIVVDGRSRVLALREIHRTLSLSNVKDLPAVKAKRWTPPQVIVKTPLFAALDVVSANWRTSREPIAIARSVTELKNLGASDEQICRAYGWSSVVTLHKYLKAADLPPSVQAAIETGKIESIDVVLPMIGMKDSDAKVRVEAMVREGVTKGSAAKRAAKHGVDAVSKSARGKDAKRESDGRATKMRRRERIEEALQRLEAKRDSVSKAQAHTLRWVLGVEDESSFSE